MPTYTNSVTRTLGEKLGEWPSVLDYSAASIDDGATDATAAIQAGLNSVASRGGGELLLVPGTYQITGAGLSIPAGVTLYGQGETSVLRRGGTLDAGRGMVNFDAVAGAGLRGIYLEGDVTTPAPTLYSAFAGDPMAGTLTQDSSVWIHEGCSTLEVSHNIFRHTGGYALVGDAIGANIVGLEINDNLLENCYPHTFGTTVGSCTNGAWTGGFFLRGDCTVGNPFAVRDVSFKRNTVRRVSGHGFWMHCLAFEVHHQNFQVQNNNFEDTGLDAIQLGGLQGYDCSGNTIHRAGYVTSDDVTDSVPTYPGYTYAVGIDNSGYVADGNISDNTITSVLGGFIDLDGVRSSAIQGNRCSLPLAGTPEYTRDGIAGYPAGLPAGLNTGNTSLNGGAADLRISDNTVVGCSTASLRLNFAKRCTVTNNKITHSSTGSEVPVQLYALDSGSEYWVQDNIISGNQISYGGANFCIAEVGDAGAYGSASCTNTIFPNYIQGANRGEFLRAPQSASFAMVRLSAADSGLTTRNETYFTKGVGALQLYNVLDTTTRYIGQWAESGPTLNVSYGSASSGQITTGLRVSAGVMSDFVFSGKQIADGFLMLGGQTFLDADADQFDATYGMFRFVVGTGTSTNTGTIQASRGISTLGSRVWQDLTFGSGAAPGADTQVVFNDAGAFGAVPSFTYNKTSGVLTLTANSTATYGDPILRVLRADLSQASDFEWSGVIQTTNAAFIAKDAGANARFSMDGNPIQPYGLRGASDSGHYWSSSAYAFDTPDLGIQRAGAGILEITNAGTGIAHDYRDLRLRNLAAFGTAADSVQTTGGFTGITFISTRTDGDSGVVLSRASGAWGLNVDSSGNLSVRDRTNNANRMVFQPNGQAILGGLANQASLTVSAGYIDSAQGFSSTNTLYNTFQAAAVGGGVYTYNSTVDNGAYFKTLGTLVSPNTPPGGYAGLGHRTGSTYWYWNGGAWASIDMAAAAGAVPGSNQQVILNSAGSLIGDSGLTFDYTSDILTAVGGAVSAVFNATGTGTAITFKNNNNRFSVDGDGNVSSVASFNSTGAVSAPYKVGGTTIVDASRNGTFVGLTFGASSALVQGATTRIDTAGTATFAAVVASGAFNSTVTGANVGFQAGAGNFQAFGNGNVNGAGNANFNGAYQIAGNTVIDSSRNGTFTNITLGATSQLTQNGTARITTAGGFIGSVFNATGTGTNITYQNSNSNFSVNGNGDVTVVGVLNNIGGYRINSTTVVDSSRNGTFASVTSGGLITTTFGNINADSSHVFSIGGAFFGTEATGGLVCGSHTLYFKGGILYAYT